MNQQTFEEWMMSVDPTGEMSVAWDRDVASKGDQVADIRPHDGKIISWFWHNAELAAELVGWWNDAHPTVFTDDGFYYEYIEDRWVHISETVEEVPPGAESHYGEWGWGHTQGKDSREYLEGIGFPTEPVAHPLPRISGAGQSPASTTSSKSSPPASTDE